MYLFVTNMAPVNFGKFTIRNTHVGLLHVTACRENELGRILMFDKWLDEAETESTIATSDEDWVHDGCCDEKLHNISQELLIQPKVEIPIIFLITKIALHCRTTIVVGVLVQSY